MGRGQYSHERNMGLSLHCFLNSKQSLFNFGFLYYTINANLSSSYPLQIIYQTVSNYKTSSEEKML